MEQFPSHPERSKRLHNFTLPHLRWGQQRFLRCVKLPHQSPSPSHRSQNGGVVTEEHGPATNGNLSLDAKSKPSVSENNGGGEVAKNNGDVVAARPWNLRTRRAACNEPGDESIIESSSLHRHVIGGDGDRDSQFKNQKVKFSVSLLREEIEEDFSALIGKRPPRRPKKRPRIVQKQMNTLFPGLWLADIASDSYDVPEAVET